MWNVAADGRDWQRLARAVVAGRVALGMRRRVALAARTGLSSRTLSDVENARKTGYDPGTYALIEQALGWAPGSCDAILDGGEPDLLMTRTRLSSPEPGVELWKVEFDAVRDQVLATKDAADRAKLLKAFKALAE